MQSELAFLLGVRGGARVSLHEKFKRNPSLEVVLAYEVIFGKPASELFAGLHRGITERVVERAKVVLHRAKRQHLGPMNKRKIEALNNLIARHSKLYVE